MRILAIDPGTYESAWLVTDDGTPVPGAFGKEPNDRLLCRLRSGDWLPDVVAIEEVRSFGMPVGQEIFETVKWTGRFAEASVAPVGWIGRKEVVVHLCGTPRASDANVRRVLMDRFGGDASIRKGGPLFGIYTDAWSALAVATAWFDTGGKA